MKINLVNARIGPRTFGILIWTFALAVVIQAHAGEEDSFIKSAAADGHFEVQAAQLAAHNASSDQVKLLAFRIVADHEKANQRLRGIAAAENVQLPTEPANKSELEKLSGLKGKAFDQEYVRIMVDDHKKAIAEYLEKAKNSKDIAVKQFASESALELQEHLDVALQVQAQLAR